MGSKRSGLAAVLLVVSGGAIGCGGLATGRTAPVAAVAGPVISPAAREATGAASSGLQGAGLAPLMIVVETALQQELDPALIEPVPAPARLALDAGPTSGTVALDLGEGTTLAGALDAGSVTASFWQNAGETTIGVQLAATVTAAGTTERLSGQFDVVATIDAATRTAHGTIRGSVLLVPVAGGNATTVTLDLTFFVSLARHVTRPEAGDALALQGAEAITGKNGAFDLALADVVFERRPAIDVTQGAITVTPRGSDPEAITLDGPETGTLAFTDGTTVAFTLAGDRP